MSYYELFYVNPIIWLILNDQVLRSLVMSHYGVLLTNDAVCEIMQSCFRICFEVRLGGENDE